MTDEHRFLTMDDGVRIAVTLHLPDDAPPPWPVVFEARPYRKDDVSDATAIYRRLCDEGALAVCRADVRGTGSSEGIADDEYTPRELEDHLRTIAWLADQEWSNGSVGMFGTSYSGFNSLQVAALRPPALKAIIPIYATDRRFTDDVHYGGGAMRGIDFLDYPMLMVAMNALPPVPSVFGDGWREEWMRRLEGTEPWFIPWLEHQREDAYWRHGSVFFDYDAIEAATMIVAGHADGYHNMAFRGFERLRGPKKLLFGPWSHMSPRFSMPGPRIDHVPEMIRWWHRWLRGDDNGVDREPPIQIFVRRSTRPRADLDAYEGEWRSEPAWPPARSRDERRTLDTADARNDGGPAGTVAIRGDVGVSGSIWCAADLPFGEPWDQRPDEAFSLVYDWPALDAPLEIMGHPRLEVTVTASAPVAFVSTKLCDVFPDGTSALVTRAIRNLTHRNGFDAPTPLPPGEPVTATIELDATSWIWEPGHRVRLDLAGSDFPSTWPPPYAGTLAVDAASSTLVLPVLDGPPVADPPVFSPGEREAHRVEHVTWTSTEDVLGRRRTVTIDHGGVRGAAAGGLGYSDTYGGEIVASIDEPGNAHATGGTVYELAWPEVQVRTESKGTLRSDATTWHLDLELEVQENGETVFTRRWERRLPRDLA
ncbi:MAG TPA: CocE/NonD family hydrolase [Actinomycetota bacterium]|nr:CocE/NonD family hydrolase [Actinomycetota bacterium]